MPVDMQRAPKIPVGGPTSDLERVEIEVVADGTYIVTCYHKAPESDAGSFTPPKKYTFQNVAAMTGFVTDKLSGRGSDMKGDAAKPKKPAGPPVVEPEEPEAPEGEEPAEY